MLVVDAHEDLAWNMLTFGRDYLRPVAETRRIEEGSDTVTDNGESCIGYPEYLAGRVAVVFGTLFAAPSRSALSAARHESSYHSTDEAHRLYSLQLDLYHSLVAANPDKFVLVQGRQDLETVLATWEPDSATAPLVGLVLLMEGADGIRRVVEVNDWYARGVRIIGPAWNRTQYVGGTGEPGGFTRRGKALLRHMARNSFVLDISHLAEAAVPEAFDLFPGMIVATHANARALLPSARRPERHLSDAAIRWVSERGGVIGVVLANFFLKDDYSAASARSSVTLAHVVAHIDHMAQVTGRTHHIGIGSDFDGGFGLSRVPSGVDSVADLPRIGELLRQRGYSDGDIAGIMGGNWLRVLKESLP